MELSAVERARLSLADYGVHREAQLLLDVAIPSVRLRSALVGNESELGVGTMKLGGRPDLDQETEWPHADAYALAFVAQIPLAEVSSLDDASLPSEGLLSFFYDVHQWPTAGDPGTNGRWRVIFSDAGTRLERRSFPHSLPDHGRFRAAGLEAEIELTLPSRASLVYPHLNEEDERYWKLELDLTTGPVHRLLGHEQPLQHGHIQALECERADGRSESGGSDEQENDDVEAHAHQWRLLLQVGSDDAAGMCWGDLGRLYYWITKSDLMDLRFDRTQVVFQSF